MYVKSPVASLTLAYSLVRKHVRVVILVLEDSVSVIFTLVGSHLAKLRLHTSGS